MKQYRVLGVVLAMSLLSCGGTIGGQESSQALDVLPVGSHPPAIDASHFPDRGHAVIWRNWQLVNPRRLAAVLDTDVATVIEAARSMGLPPAGDEWREMKRRGYITILRRNWHLLPYDQLLKLLDMSAEELAYSLREDDFLFIKLGSLKPRVAPTRYRAPDQQARARLAEIHRTVDRYFRQAFTKPAEPRFSFIEQLGRLDPRQKPSRTQSERMSKGLRFIYSYFGSYGDALSNPELDPYPDGLLARLAREGVNGVWLHIVLRNLAPGGAAFPEFGDGHERRLENLRRLVQRARQFGIGIYLYINEPRAMPASFFKERPGLAGVREGDFVAMCTSTKEVRRWMTNALTHVFREVPDLAGVFTITASENLTSCASHFRQQQCPRCKSRSDAEIIAEVNTAIAAGVKRGNADARVLCWDWGWKHHGDAPDIIAKLPKSVWLMSVSEWSKPIERGGVKTTVGEYSLSAVGPGPRAERHWKLAKKAGLKAVAKVQFNTTWELSTVPFLPALDLVAEHCMKLARIGVDGTMLSWTVGGYPSPNLRVAARFAEDPEASPGAVLNDIAWERYGTRAAPHIRRAWKAFSVALGEYPLHINVLYRGPQQVGPANLLYEKPTGYTASMVGIPYDDLERWRGAFPPAIFAAQFEKMAEGWAYGLEQFKKALPLVSAKNRNLAMADDRVARTAYLHFKSTANQTRYIMARNRLLDKNLPETDRQATRTRLRQIIEDEIRLARELFTLTRQDSRLGFEASNHYFYVPLDCVEKVINCHYLLKTLGLNN